EPFKRLDGLAAFRAYERFSLSVSGLEASIRDIDAVPYQRVRLEGANDESSVGQYREVSFSLRACSSLGAGGVGVNGDMRNIDFGRIEPAPPIPRRDLARHFNRVGRWDDNFVYAMRDERAVEFVFLPDVRRHGIDVKVHANMNSQRRIISALTNRMRAIKRIVDLSGVGFEARLILLPVCLRVERPLGVLHFARRHIAARKRRVEPGLRVRLAAFLPGYVAVAEVVKAFRRADKQRVAAARREHGPQNFSPCRVLGVGPLVAHEKEQAGAAQVVVIVEADDANHMAGAQRDRALGFVRLAVDPVFRDAALQRTPKRALGLLEARRPVPDFVFDGDARLLGRLTGPLGFLAQQERLAEASAADCEPKARRGMPSPREDVGLLAGERDLLAV